MLILERSFIHFKYFPTAVWLFVFALLEEIPYEVGGLVFTYDRERHSPCDGIT